MSNLLIVSGGNVDNEFLKEKIDYFDKVIAVDKGVESIYNLNKIPNIIVGDFDSVNYDILEFYRNRNVEIFEYNTEKDYTDTELALNIAIDFKPEKITVVGGIGTRLDHTLANIHIMKKCLEKNLICEMIDKNNKIYLVDKFRKINKEDAFGKYISIMPLTSEVQGITLKGFKYLLEDYNLEIGKSIGISNEIIEEMAIIEIKKGVLIVIESKD